MHLLRSACYYTAKPWHKLYEAFHDLILTCYPTLFFPALSEWHWTFYVFPYILISWILFGNLCSDVLEYTLVKAMNTFNWKQKYRRIATKFVERDQNLKLWVSRCILAVVAMDSYLWIGLCFLAVLTYGKKFECGRTYPRPDVKVNKLFWFFADHKRKWCVFWGVSLDGSAHRPRLRWNAHLQSLCAHSRALLQRDRYHVILPRTRCL